MSKSIIVTKSYTFAVEIVALYKYLSFEKKEYVLSRQMLKSGTSIGANVEEGQAAISKKDFIHKNSIALKEARETHYWLRLLKDSDFLKEDDIILIDKWEELKKILVSIIKTSQERL